MNEEMVIRTNHVPRPVIYEYELSIAEQAEFDYLDWTAMERGEEGATFFRYKGTLYDLGEFMTTSTLPEFNPLRKWDGYCSDSFFSGIVIKFVGDELEQVIVGTFYA